MIVNTLEDHDLAILRGIMNRLCAGSDKMRDEGNAINVLLSRVEPVDLDDIKRDGAVEAEVRIFSALDSNYWIIPFGVARDDQHWLDATLSPEELKSVIYTNK